MTMLKGSFYKANECSYGQSEWRTSEWSLSLYHFTWKTETKREEILAPSYSTCDESPFHSSLLHLCGVVLLWLPLNVFFMGSSLIPWKQPWSRTRPRYPDQETHHTHGAMHPQESLLPKWLRCVLLNKFRHASNFLQIYSWIPQRLQHH